MMCRIRPLAPLFLILSFSCSINFSAVGLVIPVNPDITQIFNQNATRHQLCPFNAKAVVSLPSDIQGKVYTTLSGYNCLDPGNPLKAECWSVLGLNEWLPQWFLKTPQCPHGSASEVECNIQDPPEPWTTTFMRIATGGGNWNGCSKVGSANCQYKSDPLPDLCAGGTGMRLLMARYNYVAYTITSTCSTLLFSDWKKTTSKLTYSKTSSNSLLGGQA